MLATRWRPWLEALSDLERLGRAARTSPNFARAYPPLNVWEDEDKIFVEAELPGFSLEDLEILVHQQHLTIQGERKAPKLENASWRIVANILKCRFEFIMSQAASINPAWT